MNHPMKGNKRYRYRLNRKKLLGTLIALALVVICIVIIVISLSKTKATVASGDISATQSVSAAQQSAAQQSTAQQSAAQQSTTQQSAVLQTTSAGTSETHSTNPAEALQGRLIVVDAGHGGFDPGTSSKGGVREDGLNLEIAVKLKTELEARGAEVIMTREDENALAATKDEDMAERRRIIQESGSDIVISVHIDSFPQDTTVSGPSILYDPDSAASEELAGRLQESLNEELEGDRGSRSQDSLIVLESGSQPSVLVECGFLSNEEEASKLQQEDYQQRVAEAICDGAAAYFSGQ